METKDYSEELDFGKYWSVLKRRWLPAMVVCGSVVGLSLGYVSLQKPVYVASGKLLFKSNQAASLTGLKNNIGLIEATSTKSDPLNTQVEIIESLPVATATVKALNLKEQDGAPMDPRDFLSRLVAKPVTGTDILQVSYSSTNPEFAAKVVNRVMQEYMANNVTSNRTASVAARDFIVKQLPETEAAVNRAENALRRFKEANGVVALEQEATSTVQSMNVLDTQIVQAQAQLEQANAKAAALRNQVGMGVDTALPLNNLNQSAGVQTALTELQKIQTELAAQRTLYRGKHPAIAQLERKEASLKQLVQTRVTQVLGTSTEVAPGKLQLGELGQAQIASLAQAEVERLSLGRQVTSLVNAQAAYIARSSSMPALEKTQRELQRKLDAAQTTYNTLLTKLQEVQVSENQDVGNAQVVSAAVPPDYPVSPKVTLTLLAGGVAGVLLGIMTAFLLDLLDRSVKTLQEAKELFGYTLLGIIPKIGGKGKFLSFREAEPEVPKVITRDCPQYPAQEAYQMLQANLKFLSSDREIKTIAITSSMRKEGKSTVAANLAVAIAQVRSRVLLVDADMRHPMQHHIWNLTNAVGLSNLIVGQVELSAVVNSVSSSLDVITCGVIPPNPLSLLDSQRMAHLIASFNQNYDFVIFDVPAVTGTADAAVVSQMTDGSVLVVQPGVVNSASGKAAKQFLAQSGQTVLGMVANNIDARREPDSYFYYTHPETMVASEPPVAV